MKNNLKLFFSFYKKQTIIEIILIILAVLTVFDMLDLPTKFIDKYSIFAYLLTGIFLIFILLNKRIYNFLKINTTNYIDIFLISTTISVFLYTAFTKLFSYSVFKFITLVSILIFLLIICIIRCVVIYNCIKKKKNIKAEINVMDIKQLYNNEIECSDKNLIFLEEKDVNYDLLNRGKIITELYNSINLCKNNTKFIISLTGNWGSGKTTILNIVKNRLSKNEYIVIDKFDAWKFNNEEYLFYAMFDEIIKNTGIKFSTLEVRKFVKLCNNMLSSKIDLKLTNNDLENRIIDNIKDTINNFLELNNKRVVFIIDNLERTNEENILLILRTISTILDLNRFIYVLSYDEDEMKDIFENKLKINYDYIEKVVQLPLKVPQIDKYDIDKICTRCMSNLLIYYGIDKKEIEKYMPAIKLFNSKIKDLRSFKRKINSIFNCNFYCDNYLNRIDAFLLELIHEENYSLYNHIRNNYKYFVSEDQIAVYGYSMLSAKEYNEETTNFFDELFSNSENKKYKDILKLLFPNVNKFLTAYRIDNRRVEFWNESSIIVPKEKKEYYQSIIDRRIYNAKFFDLYFTKQKNEFIDIDNMIIEFVKYINNEEYQIDDLKAIQEIQQKLGRIIYLYQDASQKYILETMEIHIDKIEKNKLILLLCLIESQNFVNNEPIFFGINSNERLEIICAKLSKKLSDKELDEFKNIIKINYKNMFFIRRMLYWINPKDKYNLEDTDQELYNQLNECYSKLLINVVEKNINIYTKEHFCRHNILCLMEDEKYKSQIKNINENTIFKFLVDMVSISCGTNGYGYSINKETLDKFMTYEKIDEYIKKTDLDNITEIEKFILEVYNKSKQKEEGVHENTLYRDKYIEIKHI